MGNILNSKGNKKNSIKAFVSEPRMSKKQQADGQERLLAEENRTSAKRAYHLAGLWGWRGSVSERFTVTAAKPKQLSPESFQYLNSRATNL